MDARIAGNLTSSGIEPRISHQYSKMSRVELDRSLDEVDYSLFLLAKAAQCGPNPDHSLLELYQNPYHHTSRKVRTVYGWPFPYQTQPTIL